MRHISSRIHIDIPGDSVLRRAICTVDGWFTWPSGNGAPSLKVNGTDLLWIPSVRPDVQAAFPSVNSQGFRAVVNVSDFLNDPNWSREQLTVQLFVAEAPAAQTTLFVGGDCLRESVEAQARRQSKHQWLKTYLTCPVCPISSDPTLNFSDDQICCTSCGSVFADIAGIFGFLPEDLAIRHGIDRKGDISAHHYDPVAMDVVEWARRQGGKALDCGSGVRPQIDDAVICVEIEPYPSVDVLAVNQRLPFRDSTFDAVLSLNVLEHVTDPFACAAELVRVLKPGGLIYCCIPFLQPEHGYPHHYFNATRSGLRQLFPADFELRQHEVPMSGQPVWTLHWFLSSYANFLPPAVSRKFRNMRIGDVIKKPVSALLDEAWVRQLPEEGRWKLASTTAAVLRKPGETPGSVSRD